jgi:hypothetical protein
LGQRDRKRRREGEDAAGKKRRVLGQPERPPAGGPRAAAEPRNAIPLERPLSRTEAKNAAVRAELEPFAPGERPRTIQVAVATAVFLALANVIAFAAGVRVKGQESQTSGVVIFGALMLVAAWGMWNLRYWAVLGFQALLAITVIIAGLSLLVASNLAAVALSGSVTVLGGWLFWKLVRTMARIQLPERRPSSS